MTRDCVFAIVQTAPTRYAEADDKSSYTSPVRLPSRWEEPFRHLINNPYPNISYLTESSKNPVYDLQPDHTLTLSSTIAGLDSVGQHYLSHPLGGMRLDAHGVPGWEDDAGCAVDLVCDFLRRQGHISLADRIGYFASDDDLDDGDVPLTPASSRGFLRFLDAVKTDGDLDVTCTPEGWICATWSFSDKRRAAIWFIDESQVMFAAKDKDGSFVEIDGGSEKGSSSEIMVRLVDAGLFRWRQSNTTSLSNITWLGTAENGISAPMGYPKTTLFV